MRLITKCILVPKWDKLRLYYLLTAVLVIAVISKILGAIGAQEKKSLELYKEKNI